MLEEVRKIKLEKGKRFNINLTTWNVKEKMEFRWSNHRAANQFWNADRRPEAAASKAPYEPINVPDSVTGFCT